MEKIKSKYRIIILCSVLLAILLIVGVLSRPSYANQPSQKFWLSSYEGKMAVVTFITKPPEMEQVSRGRLIGVESTGVILRFSGTNNVFYPYSNIISIDPE